LGQGKRAFEGDGLVASDPFHLLQISQRSARQFVQSSELLNEPFAEIHRRNTLGTGTQQNREQFGIAETFRSIRDQPLAGSFLSGKVFDSDVVFLGQRGFQDDWPNG
jgi:hypothetical protein